MSSGSSSSDSASGSLSVTSSTFNTHATRSSGDGNFEEAPSAFVGASDLARFFADDSDDSGASRREFGDNRDLGDLGAICNFGDPGDYGDPADLGGIFDAPGTYEHFGDLGDFGDFGDGGGGGPAFPEVPSPDALVQEDIDSDAETEKGFSMAGTVTVAVPPARRVLPPIVPAAGIAYDHHGERLFHEGYDPDLEAAIAESLRDIHGNQRPHSSPAKFHDGGLAPQQQRWAHYGVAQVQHVPKRSRQVREVQVRCHPQQKQQQQRQVQGGRQYMTRQAAAKQKKETGKNKKKKKKTTTTTTAAKETNEKRPSKSPRETRRCQLAKILRDQNLRGTRENAGLPVCLSDKDWVDTFNYKYRNDPVYRLGPWFTPPPSPPAHVESDARAKFEEVD